MSSSSHPGLGSAVEHDERSRVGVGAHTPLEQARAAGERLPVDARGGAPGTVGAQPVELGRGQGLGQRASGRARRVGPEIASDPLHWLGPRKHQQLVRWSELAELHLGEPEHVATHDQRRVEHACGPGGRSWPRCVTLARRVR